MLPLRTLRCGWCLILAVVVFIHSFFYLFTHSHYVTHSLGRVEGCASACCYPSSEAAADLTLIDEVTQLRHGKDHRAVSVCMRRQCCCLNCILISQVMAEYTRKEGLPNDSNCCMMCCCPEAYAKRCADDRRRRKSTLSAMSMPTSTPGLSSPPAAQPTGAPPSYSAAMATK